MSRPGSHGSCPVPVHSAERIEIGHGGGGKLTQRLIDTVFRPAFAVSDEDLTCDSAAIGRSEFELAFTTDAYVVQPLFFPGGNIGSLAIFGTVNDLAMSGARALAISAAFVIEEGFAVTDLNRIVETMRDAASRAGVRIVAGDTKVVERGKADGVYIATSGIGEIGSRALIRPQEVRVGDAVIVSGDIGRHGMAVMAARESLGFEPPIESDCAPLFGPVSALIDGGIELHCLRDCTRGGLATALIEIARCADVTIAIEQTKIPVSGPVRGACEILGIDPLYVANEGRFTAIVAGGDAERALSILQRHDDAAAIIGMVGERDGSTDAKIRTIGRTRALDLQTGEQLPRIC
ncbi:hydrogenase expression/formation protein HypE [Pontixanthobacter gangjinensis]